MTAAEIRRQVREAYSSKTWTVKVDRMKDPQLFAIFVRLKGKGII